MSQINERRQITVAEMSPHVHSFSYGENKVNKISLWLIEWIKSSLKKGKIKPFDLLPLKGDLAFHVGVSKGTIQNVFRYVEDCGWIESKQKIGTYIKGDNTDLEKLTSKRELAVEGIKKIIIENDLKKGDILFSTRKLSQLMGISSATVRMAISSLISEQIVIKNNKVFLINRIDFEITNTEACTLVKKIALKIKEYALSNYKQGEKLPANFELADRFNVSVKTIHDAIKMLSKEGILYTRRGQYGTILAFSEQEEKLYCYEEIELKLKHYISTNCEIGSRLPSIIDLSKHYNVSAKTIKKALDELAEEGYITFTRGRYGGSFVTDIPQTVNEAYKWLALSPGYTPNMEN